MFIRGVRLELGHFLVVLSWFCWLLLPGSDAAFSFTKTPANPTVVVRGHNSSRVALEWKYALGGETFLALQIKKFNTSSLRLESVATRATGSVGKIADPFSQSRHFEFQDPATLVINNVTTADANSYQCMVITVELVEGHKSEVNVKVYNLPENTSLTVHHENTSAVELGAVVNFTCTSVGDPAPHQFNFYKDETKIAVSSSGFFSTAVSKSGVLIYSCEAVNILGQQRSNNVNITVFEPPGVTVTRDTNVTEGDNITLTCNVTGVPAPSVEWTKVGEPAVVLSRTNDLTLYSVTRPGNGNPMVQYTCTASNGYGEPASDVVNVTVFSPANVSIVEPTAVEGCDVVLVCIADGYPTPHVFWIAPNGTYLKNGTGGANFTLRNVSRHNNESYECRAKNQVGPPDSENITLDVLYPAKILKIWVNGTLARANSKDVEEHDDVVIKVDVEGNPKPDVKWSPLNNQICRPGRTCIIQKITRKGGGGFIISANNSVGNDSKDFQLNVKYIEVRLYVISFTNHDVLYCEVDGYPVPNVTIGNMENASIVASERAWVQIDLKRGEEGNFTCTASNRQQSTPKSIFVKGNTEGINGVIEIQDNFSSEFRDMSSKEAQDYIRHVAQQFSQELKRKDIDVQKLRIHSLSPGSVVVNFTVIIRNLANLNKTYWVLKEAIADGRLGALRVNSSYVKLIPPPTEAPPPTTGVKPVASDRVDWCNGTCKNGGRCNSDKTGCDCPYIKGDDYCGGFISSLGFLIIICCGGVIVVVVPPACICCWCKKRRKCQKASVDCVDDEVALRDGTDGNRAAFAMENVGYANEGPSADTGYVQVNRESATGAAEGNYAEVGGAGGGVPALKYASVDKSKDKKKKKKKGEKLENNELQEVPVYAQVDKSKKKGEAPEATYAQVDMSKKKKKSKDGEGFYADLAQFPGWQGGMTSVQVSPPATLGPIIRPPKYEETQYADISQFSLKRKEVKPAKGEGDTTEGGTEGKKPEGEAEKDKPEGVAEVEIAASPAATPSAVTLVKEEDKGEKEENNDSKM